MIVVWMLSIKNVNIEVSCEKECGRRVLNSQNLFQLLIQSSQKEVGADGGRYKQPIRMLTKRVSSFSITSSCLSSVKSELVTFRSVL